LHEDADEQLRQTGESKLSGPRTFGAIYRDLDDLLLDFPAHGYSAKQQEIFWLRFFLRRSRRRLTAAGFLRKGQRSRRLHGDWSEARIITEEAGGLPGVVLAVLSGYPRDIPRILACIAPAPEASFKWKLDKPLGSHSQGWYEPEAFCAVSIGSEPRILEGRLSVPEERLPELFAWIRTNRAVLFHLWRMGAHRAADWPLAGLRALEDAQDLIKKPDRKSKDYSEAYWHERERAQNAFMAAVERTLGDALRADEHLCARLWGAMTNTTWLHVDGLETSFSFRKAGGLIAELRGEGANNYMRWYMSGLDGSVHSEIALALEPEGWFWGWNGSELTGHSAADCDIRNDCAREYRERRNYFSSEGAAEIALRQVEKTWNKLTGRRKT
jgi:hypothetical protein